MRQLQQVTTTLLMSPPVAHTIQPKHTYNSSASSPPAHLHLGAHAFDGRARKACDTGAPTASLPAPERHRRRRWIRRGEAGQLDGQRGVTPG